MKLVKIYADSAIEWNCSEWRDLAPSDAINKAAEAGTLDPTKWSCKLVHVSGFADYLNPVIQQWLAPAEFITVQRNLINDEVIDAMRYWLGMGKILVGDLDDAYPILPPSNPAYPFWIDNKAKLEPPPLEMLERGLATCGFLTSPNRLILKDWAHVARGFHLPNYARGEWWRAATKTRAEMKAEKGIATDRIVIGWGGSVSHYDSWWGSQLFAAAHSLTKRFPQIVWMICGNDPRIYHYLPVPKANKMLQPGVEAKDWPQIVKTFDIGVAPLHGPYDQRRSWIKTMEYGLAGVPWVATAGEPYSDFTEFGALVTNTESNWEAALETIVRNLESHHQVAASRIPLMQGFFIENKLGVYETIFNQIQNSQQAFNQSLPRLFHVNWNAADNSTTGRLG